MLWFYKGFLIETVVSCPPYEVYIFTVFFILFILSWLSSREVNVSLFSSFEYKAVSLNYQILSTVVDITSLDFHNNFIHVDNKTLQ